MKRKFKKNMRRIWAIWMVLMMLVSILSDSGIVYADNAPSVTEPQFIVMVQHGSTRVKDAVVSYTVEETKWVTNAAESGGGHSVTEVVANEDVNTDENGKAELKALKALELEDTGAYTIKGTVVKSGFYDYKIPETAIDAKGLSIAVSLEKAYTVKVTNKKTQKTIANATVQWSLYTKGSDNTKQYVTGKQDKIAQTDENGIATLQDLTQTDLSDGVHVEMSAMCEPEYTATDPVTVKFDNQCALIEMQRKVVDLTVESATEGNRDNFTVLVDNENVPQYVAKDGNTALSIKPKDGYVITSVTINGKEQLGPAQRDVGIKSCGCTIEESQKQQAQAIIVKVKVEAACKITVQYNDAKGTVSTNALGKEEEIDVIKKDGNLIVTAKPKEGYRLTSVKLDGIEQVAPADAGKNGNNWDKHLTVENITKDVTLKFEFLPNIYQVSVKTNGQDAQCDWYFKGLNSKKNYMGEYGTNATLYFTKSMNVMVSQVLVNGSPVKSHQDSQDGNLFELSIPIKEETKVDIVYTPVTIIAPDESNPLEKKDAYSIDLDPAPVRTMVKDGRTIYILSNNAVAKVNAMGGYRGVSLNEGSQYDRDKHVYIVDEDHIEKVISAINLFIDSKTLDRVMPLNLGFLVDKEAPEIGLQIDASQLSNSEKNLYSKDVTVDVSVNEKILGEILKTYSGIKTVKYWITVGNEPQTEENAKILYSCADNELKGSLADKIVVKASEFNCDDIKVTVVAEDFAGNVSRPETRTLNIDASAPQVSLTYDNNDNYKDSKYFNKPRTATLVIKERSDFDLDAAKGAIKIEAKDIKGNAVEGAYAISDWTVAKNVQNDNDTTYTAKISFNEDANYKLSMQFTDAAGNLNDEIDTGKSVAPYEFTVDTTAPSAEVKAKSSEGRASKWEGLVTDARFSYFSKKGITISGTATDLTSPILSTEYYKQTRKTGEAALKAMTVAELNAIKGWKKLEEFSVTSDEEFIVYIKALDAAGNCTYISTDGLIVDKNSPRKETLAPKVTAKPAQPVNGFYSKDVVVNLKVEDPDVNGAYTGLKEVTYKVYNMSESDKTPTQQGTLYSYDGKKTAKTDLIKDYAGKITIDSTKNNSNHVKVVIYAEDNAGNGQTEELKLKIDTTAPTVDIRYANNDEASDKYFNADRTATITVTERNFDKKDMDIEITNSDGKAPTVSAWTKKKGAGNGDDTKWVATVKYEKDGDYTFDIHYKDRAGNKAKINYAEDTVAAKEFTIDKTNPKIEVSYDSNNAHNGEYYNTARRATVTITEHNFDPERVDAGITAVENGQNVGAPEISGWTNNGDVHTATISYAKDAKYTFNISAIDMAGNEAENFAEQSFYVDQTEPVLEINGVEDLSANAGDVIPVVTYSDDNFDANALNIKLTGANRKEVQLDGSYANTATGGTFTFKNFAKTQDVDDIYTLSATMTDKAGNEVSKEITFSVNRFGSTYDFNDQTDSMNGNFVQAADDVVVVETNPTPLSDIKVTLFQNNETTVLAEGTDYDLSTTGGNGQWYHYTYTVHKSVFEKDGVYKLVLHSKDGAENISENILESKDAEISFGVDKTAPNIVVANLESKKTYAVDNMTVIMSANDNLKLTDVTVYLDDKMEKEWKDSALEEMIDQDGELQFDIPGTSNKAHTVKIVCHDAAGNEAVQEITGFYVTTNIWVRYFNNKPLFYGSICGVIVVLGAGVFFVLRRRKKVTK